MVPKVSKPSGAASGSMEYRICSHRQLQQLLAGKRQAVYSHVQQMIRTAAHQLHPTTQQGGNSTASLLLHHAWTCCCCGYSCAAAVKDVCWNVVMSCNAAKLTANANDSLSEIQARSWLATTPSKARLCCCSPPAAASWPVLSSCRSPGNSRHQGLSRQDQGCRSCLLLLFLLTCCCISQLLYWLNV
jgi:hypothetical protein